MKRFVGTVYLDGPATLSRTVMRLECESASAFREYIVRLCQRTEPTMRVDFGPVGEAWCSK